MNGFKYVSPDESCDYPSSQRRLGPSPINITLTQLCVYILASQNLIGMICLIRLCSGLGPSLRWDDEYLRLRAILIRKLKFENWNHWFPNFSRNFTYC